MLLLCLQGGYALGGWDLSNMVTGEGDRTTYHAKPLDKKFLNPWPAELEEKFQQRAHSIISAQRRDVKAGCNTYFENEKRTYGYLMAHVLGGNAEVALKHLQARDHQHEIWHRETAGIDYYACFTIKHQVRKYFYFGDLLDPTYRRRMFDGAKKWTAKDPMRRPHYAYAGKSGWGPDARNSWVDIRSTENLYLMRETSVYLMAEETGNRDTTALYKKHLLDYTRTLYRIGIGEWDSENYHGHSITPLAVVNLARKAFDRPVEIFAAKPGYDATTKHRFESGPEYLETQYIANSYLVGSLTGGTSVDGGDVNGFKVLVYDEENGAVALHAAPGSNPLYPGSPMYKKGIVSAQNRVAQLENLVLWLAKDGKAPWLWVIPQRVRISTEDSITFLECDRSWVAIRTLGAGTFTVHDSLKVSAEVNMGKDHGRFPGHRALTTRGEGTVFSGLAIEVGEKESHGSIAKFKRAAKSAEVDMTELDEGVAHYKSADGKQLGIDWRDDPLDLGVWRNGKRRDLKNAAMYESPVISADWGEGMLEVKAGGETFRCNVDAEGKVR